MRGQPEKGASLDKGFGPCRWQRPSAALAGQLPWAMVKGFIYRGLTTLVILEYTPKTLLFY